MYIVGLVVPHPVLRDADYGLRGFVFADPDGNRIDVGQRLPPCHERAEKPG
ncbi:MAG: hypothetical protein ABSA53_27510 [Streptosporangiaceae bacterium]|jgi:hypothetical protein